MMQKKYNIGTKLFKITILFLLLEGVSCSPASESEWKCDVQNIRRKKPNSGDCSKYFECKWKGIGDYDLEEIVCPDSRVFDPEIGVCLMANPKFDKSKCQKSGSSSSSPSAKTKSSSSSIPPPSFAQPVFPSFPSMTPMKPIPPMAPAPPAVIQTQTVAPPPPPPPAPIPEPPKPDPAPKNAVFKKLEESEKNNFHKQQQPKIPKIIVPDFFPQSGKASEPIASRSEFQKAFIFPTIPKIPQVKQIAPIKLSTKTTAKPASRWQWKTHEPLTKPYWVKPNENPFWR